MNNVVICHEVCISFFCMCSGDKLPLLLQSLVSPLPHSCHATTAASVWQSVCVWDSRVKWGKKWKLSPRKRIWDRFWELSLIPSKHLLICKRWDGLAQALGSDQPFRLGATLFQLISFRTAMWDFTASCSSVTFQRLLPNTGINLRGIRSRT